MVSLDQAFALFHFGTRAICREIETGRLHFQETDSGSLLICLDSLQKVAQQSPGNSNPPINQIKEISS
jgi:hypothetical protein